MFDNGCSSSIACLHIIIVVFKVFSLDDNRIIKSSAIAQYHALKDPLNSFGSYFWGYTKDVAYQIAPTTKDNMDRIRRACRANTQQTLQGVMQNFKRQLTLRLENETEHFEHLLPRTIRNNG